MASNGSMCSVSRQLRSSFRQRLQQFSCSCYRRDNVPSIAPKRAVDVRHIRENPELYSRTCIDRNYEKYAESPYKIIKLFDKWQALQRSSRGARERSNSLRTKLSHTKTFSGRAIEDQSTPQDKEAIRSEARQAKEKISEIELNQRQIDVEIDNLAIEIPNLTSSDTPIGDEPRIVGYLNDHPQTPSSSYDRTWRHHVHIGTELDLLDFTAASITSGSGWYYLKNEAALLELALVQYAISVALKHQFTVVSPPSVVYSHISDACGFRSRDPSGKEQIYSLRRSDADVERLNMPDLSLSGTAEIPFASMKADTVMEKEEMPLRIIGSSRCYRAEAGKAGVDTKGLYRVHEFTKVEMFGWTLPDGSEIDLFNTMLKIQKQILEGLGLHCRILEMPSYDLGASAVRKQDIEAFFPSRREKHEGWGEVTSTSICTDYQTRRLATRVRTNTAHKPSVISKMDFPYTVNGTAVAVPRIIAAILENHWNEKEMCVRVPEVLWPWMHGLEVIRKRR